MAKKKVSWGRKFKTKSGVWGRYKYVNNKRVAFVATKRRK